MSRQGVASAHSRRVSRSTSAIGKSAQRSHRPTGGGSRRRPRQPLYSSHGGTTDAWIRKLLKAGVLSPDLLKKANEQQRIALRRARRGLAPGEEDDGLDVWDDDDEEEAQTSSARGLNHVALDKVVRPVPERVVFSKTKRFQPMNPVDAEVARRSVLPSSTQYSPNPFAQSVKPGGTMASRTRTRGGIFVKEPSKKSPAFASNAPRVKPPLLTAGVSAPLQYSSTWSSKPENIPGGVLPKAPRNIHASIVRNSSRPTSAPLVYTDAYSTDIQSTLQSTPIRYAACMRETGKDPVRFPMTQVRPQYSRPIGPFEYADGVLKHKAKPVSEPFDKKRQSSMFRSKTKRFKEKKVPTSFATDGDWSYSLFSHGLGLGPRRNRSFIN